MRRRVKVIIAGGVAAAAIATTAGAVSASAGGDDQPLAGESYDRAAAAALEHTGGGEITETELGDGGAAYEVEVRLGDGRQVEVQLDQDFAVIGSENDDDSEEADGVDD
jgi:uncharacterized membrane protein YkoI